jgi:hypothetical protein
MNNYINKLANEITSRYLKCGIGDENKLIDKFEVNFVKLNPKKINWDC